MKNQTTTPEPTAGWHHQLVLLVWQTVETSKGKMFLDIHREDAEPIIVAAIKQAQDWGMDDDMRIIRTAIDAVFSAHEDRLRECMSDSVNTERSKAMMKAGCSW